MRIGILAFHGDVKEHENALINAGQKLKLQLEIIFVRTQGDIANLDGIIIPGGESPTLQKLCQRAGIWNELKKVRNIFGTCAGAILLAKNISNISEGQETLQLMNIDIDRNAYGRQADSFEKPIETTLSTINAVFIRAPRIKIIKANITVLAKNGEEVVACEQKSKDHFYLACTFHPELTTTKFHEYFLGQIEKKGL